MMRFNKPKIITYGEVEHGKTYVCSSGYFFMVFEQFVLCSTGYTFDVNCSKQFQTKTFLSNVVAIC
jgi:hypothetical protein